MVYKTISDIQINWGNEINSSLDKIKSIYIAVLLTNGTLLFANTVMRTLLGKQPANSFINPSFNRLNKIKSKGPLIFEGFATFGDYSKVNMSIISKIYRRNNELLIIGGVESEQLLEQNKAMHLLNQENTNLQRTLLKNKFDLESTVVKLNEVNKELEKLNVDKDRFISLIAHDLRNPFIGILGLTNELKTSISNNESDDVEILANLIFESVNHTNNLLNNLLQWARAESGKMTFNPVESYLEDIIHKAIAVNQNAANDKNISITFNNEMHTKPFVDIDMIETIVRNLLSNAIKFTNIGGNIRIKTSQDNSFCKISVSDNGLGIPKDKIHKLLDVSSSYSTKGTANEKGTGFGLKICKELIDMHRGIMKVNSTLNKGTEIVLSIPLKVI